MENIQILGDLADEFNTENIIKICDILTNPTSNKEKLSKYIKEEDIVSEIFNTLNVSLYLKQTEFETWLATNPKIILKTIEDWKDQHKFNLILLLLSLNYINADSLHQIIGKHSKKTYKNGLIINDNSLALKKFFSKEYKEYRTGFYKQLDTIIKKIKTKNNAELIEKTIYLMIGIIQADIVCRNKYDNAEYFEYKTKINDIVETRNKEDMLYDYFNKLTYYKLVNEPLHESLHFLLFNSWKDTEVKYTWLTKLITFINNGSIDAKDYLINTIGIPKFDYTDYKIKCRVIKEVAQKVKLNMKYINEIIKYIFSIGTFYKHRTYNKWYNNELETINTFDKYKENELEETLKNLTVGLDLEEDVLNELMTLLSNYYLTLSKKFFI